MAKRYYTTDLFDDAWFMDLPSKYKLFWIYLLTKCNHSGIWQVNWKIAQFYTGDNLEPTEVQRILKDRIISFENNKYWFIPKFIEFQYGTKLNKDSSVHKGIIENIIKYKLCEFIPNIEISEKISKGLGNPYERIKDKDKDKDKVKEQANNVLEQSEEVVDNKGKKKEYIGEFKNVGLTDNELTKLNERFGVDLTNRLIEKLSTYIQSSPQKAKKYKSHYSVLIGWVIESVLEHNPPKFLTPEQLRECEKKFSKIGAKYQFNNGKFYLR